MLMFRLSVVSILVLFFNFQVSHSQTNTANQSTVVKTLNGEIEGIINDGVYVWKGIPYAEAPVADLRYRNPVPVKSWDGKLDATKFKGVCPQNPGILTAGEEKNENCLFLNIWSPAPDGKKRPVMFWIHGGGFMSGSGSSESYDGNTITKRGDIVLVTINYRLGPLGFLYFKNLAKKDQGFDNNLGIKDQIVALKWVHDNIASFGGDPEAVTIFGESAGARSVLALMDAPSAKGLFKRAIAQSPTPKFSWTPEVATVITKTYLDILHISYDNVAALKNLPIDTLLKAIPELDVRLNVGQGWNKVFTPTIDDDPLLYGKEASDAIDFMIGTNKNESNLFVTKQMGMMPSNAKGLKPYLVGMDSVTVMKVLKSYKKYPHRKAVLEIMTDAIFRIPSIEYANNQSKTAKVYMYRFDWCSFPLKMVGLHSFHGLELPFVFGNPEAALSKKMLVMASKKNVASLSNSMQQAWINFARTGNPNDAGKNDWPNYTSENRATWIFDHKNALQLDPDSLQRKAWSNLDF